GGIVNFNGSLTAKSLTTVFTAGDVALKGAVNTIGAGGATFNNSGTTTIGDQNTDSSTFAGTLNLNGSTATHIAGGVSTSGGNLIAAAGTTLTATDNATISTPGSVVTIGTV